MYTLKTKCMYKCIKPINTYIYIQNIYTQKHLKDDTSSRTDPSIFTSIAPEL